MIINFKKKKDELERMENESEGRQIHNDKRGMSAVIGHSPDVKIFQMRVHI